MSAWTEGPWCVYPKRVDHPQVWQGSDPEIEGHSLLSVLRAPRDGYAGNAGLNWGDRDQAVFNSRTDAALIALAPEMADAILGAYDGLCNVCDIMQKTCDDPVCIVAAKLRAISPMETTQ